MYCHYVDDNVITNNANVNDMVSCDKQMNFIGTKLLDLCKTTGDKVVNGRTGKDRSTGKFTCMTR